MLLLMVVLLLSLPPPHPRLRCHLTAQHRQDRDEDAEEPNGAVATNQRAMV